MTARRSVIVAGITGVATVWLRPALATPESMRAAIAAFSAGAAIQDGRVKLEVAPLIDNGNSVPLAVRVASPMTEADHVTAIALFNELNPNTLMAVFHLGPRAGVATVATRIRLATSQQIVALAKMADGSCWRASADVVVAIAACIEG